MINCETYKYKCHDFDSCKHTASGLTFNRPISSINSCNLFVSCIAIGWNSRNRSVSPSVVPSYSWLHPATNNYDTLTKRARPRLTKKIKRKETRNKRTRITVVTAVNRRVIVFLDCVQILGNFCSNVFSDTVSLKYNNTGTSAGASVVKWQRGS